MKNWINKTKTAVTTTALLLTLLVQGTQVINYDKEIYIKESVGLTQYTTPETTSLGQGDTESTQNNDNNMGNTAEFKDEEILYSSYYSYGAGCFSVELVKKDLNVTTSGAVSSSMGNTGIASSQQLLDACLSETEKAELEAGANKEIRVVMKQMVEEGLTDSQNELMEQAMEEYTKTYKGFQVGSYIKISIAKKNEKGKWKKIKELNNDIKLFIDVPQISQISDAKGYYLLQMRNGEYSLIEDEDHYLETMTVAVSGAAMCAIGYNLPVAETTPTAKPVQKPSYWNQMINGDLCVWHWFDISILIIGITWLLAIESKKIRIIFLSVVSILCLIIAIMGSCIYDWIFAIGCIVVMVLVHIGKTFYKRHNKWK